MERNFPARGDLCAIGEAMGNVVNFENAFWDHLFSGAHRRITLAASGKAIAIADTAAKITSYCESADYPIVIIPDKGSAYSISATIAPVSDKLIIGAGDAELDWGGAAGGYMFNNAAAGNIIYDNLHFKKTGNDYKPMALRAGANQSDMLHQCLIEDTGDDVEILGNFVSIVHCEIYTSVLFDSAASLVDIERSYFGDVVSLKDCSLVYFDQCHFRETVKIFKGNAYTSSYNFITFNDCDFSIADPNILFDLDGVSPATIKVP